ncbi:MAG: hypothetical protein IPI58_01275 [Alphaproteobacteria bacterium]|nr:MAG: hypothetical protein IPI58_01275 [Alphaproteobacteria bacterium]
MSQRKMPVLLLSAMLLAAAPMTGHAEVIVADKQDDQITLPISVEGWVVSKTARVMVNVSMAVEGGKAGSARDAMSKAVQGLAQGEWRPVGFSRSQDNTGLERWDVQYETRLQESVLGGIHDRAKSASKAGMQISVGGIDFSPTLEEMEATKLELRRKLYARAQQELEAANASLPGRSYRIAEMGFEGLSGGAMMARGARAMMMKSMSASDESAPMMAAAPAPSGSDMSTSQRLTMSANLVLKAVPPAATR